MLLSLIQLILFFPKLMQWVLTWTGRSWTFRSVSSSQYLGLAGASGNGTKLLAVAEPFEWDIWHDEIDQTTFR